MDTRKVNSIINRILKVKTCEYLYISNKVKKFSHINNIQVVFELYISEYINSEYERIDRFNFDFNTLDELEQFLKDNLDGYK